MRTIFTTKDSRRLCLFIQVNGKTHEVQFAAPMLGNKPDKEAIFTTYNDALSDALKKHSYYNRIFFLKKEIPDEAKIQAIEPNAGSTAIDYNALCDCSKDIVTAEQVTNIAEARAFIQMHYGDVIPGRSVDEIKRHAATKYNVLFPNWR